VPGPFSRACHNPLNLVLLPHRLRAGRLSPWSGAPAAVGFPEHFFSFSPLPLSSVCGPRFSIGTAVAPGQCLSESPFSAFSDFRPRHRVPCSEPLAQTKIMTWFSPFVLRGLPFFCALNHRASPPLFSPPGACTAKTWPLRPSSLRFSPFQNLPVSLFVYF